MKRRGFLEILGIGGFAGFSGCSQILDSGENPHTAQRGAIRLEYPYFIQTPYVKYDADGAWHHVCPEGARFLVPHLIARNTSDMEAAAPRIIEFSLGEDRPPVDGLPVDDGTVQRADTLAITLDFPGAYANHTLDPGEGVTLAPVFDVPEPVVADADAPVSWFETTVTASNGQASHDPRLPARC